MKNPLEKDQRVIGCLLRVKYDFRTVQGIAKDTGIDEAEVETILETSIYARKSFVTDKIGNKLFTHKKYLMSSREIVSLVQNILAP